MLADAFLSRRLSSGAAGKIRRPRPSSNRASRSAGGSKPKIDSLKPFCPSAFPWQPEELQPKRLKIGQNIVLEVQRPWLDASRRLDGHDRVAPDRRRPQFPSRHRPRFGRPRQVRFRRLPAFFERYEADSRQVDRPSIMEGPLTSNEYRQVGPLRTMRSGSTSIWQISGDEGALPRDAGVAPKAGTMKIPAIQR